MTTHMNIKMFKDTEIVHLVFSNVYLKSVSYLC